MNLKLKISIVGMPQGGTTALYNIVNFILRENNEPVKNFLYHPTKKYNSVVNEKYLRSLDHESHTLIKEHHYVPFLCNEWSDIVFVMKRDIRECIASRRRRGKSLSSKGKRASGLHKYNPETFEGLQNWCDYLVEDCYLDWTNNAKKNQKNIHEFDYTLFKKDQKKTVRDVFHALTSMPNMNIHLDENKIIENINDLSKFDKDITFFSPGKVTNKGRVNDFTDCLSEKELKYIEDKFQDWINVSKE